MCEKDASAFEADAFLQMPKVGDSMYSLKTSASFDSAHFLKDYNGKCANIHGHRWTVEAVIAKKELQQNGEKCGMIIDFSDFKTALRMLADSFDHTLIFETNSLKENTLTALREEGFRLTEVPFRPTAENLARYFFEKLKFADLPVYSVTVYETPNNSACYTEDEDA